MNAKIASPACAELALIYMSPFESDDSSCQALWHLAQWFPHRFRFPL